MVKNLKVDFSSALGSKATAETELVWLVVILAERLPAKKAAAAIITAKIMKFKRGMLIFLLFFIFLIIFRIF